MKTFSWDRGWLVGAVVLFSSVGAMRGQTAAPERIGSLAGSAKVALPDSVPSRLGAMQLGDGLPATQQIPGLALRFSMTVAQQADLTQLLNDQQNPASASYHQWLTPEQFATRFGMASSDLAKAKAWLVSQGFTVSGTARGGQFIRFSGTAAQVEAAFSTHLATASVQGRSGVVNTQPVQLPAALAGVTSAITGLNTVSLTARNVRHTVQVSADGSLAPQYTTSSGNHYLAPGDLYTIYNSKGLLSAGTNGSGVTIAVVGQTDIYPADIAAFRSAAGLSANAATVALYGVDPGYPSTNDLAEAELDLEWTGAMAPGATLLYVNATDVLNGSITEVIDNNLAPILANSYGTCEAELGVGQLAYYNQLLQQGAAQGITIVSPAGDAGAADCDSGANSATQGLGVDFPGSSPFVTSVGATTLTEGSGSYWSSSNGTNAGSAQSYIPESVWNETTSGSTLRATGGGSSAYFAKPSWQRGTVFGVTLLADGTRDTPDVALAGSPSHDPYLICLPAGCTNGFLNAGGSVTAVGGTSVSAPVLAGALALVVQKQGRVGVANNMLYALANSTYASNVFHDITAGSNAVPCTTGTMDCASTTLGYTAATGYDRASGLGTLDFGNLVNDWSLVTPFTTAPSGVTGSRVDVVGKATSVSAGTSIAFTATVSSVFSTSTATPTGTVQFLVDGSPVGSSIALSGAAAGYTLSTTGLTAGTHKVQASYSGDSTYAGSVGAFTITVATAATAGFTLSPAQTTLNVASGAISQGVVLSVTPTGGFNGNVSFALSSASNFAGQITLSSTSLTITGTSAATTTLAVLAFTGTLAHHTAGTLSLGWAAGGLTLILLSAATKRRSLRTVALTLAFAAASAGLAGCSPTATTPTANQSARTPTPAGTYQITVSATGTVNGASVTRNSVVTVVVQ